MPPNRIWIPVKRKAWDWHGGGGASNSALAASVALAKPWDRCSSVTDWLMSEKLDGP